MKNLGEFFISDKPQAEILMGNYALLRAFIETGTKVITSYPGSPTVEIAEAIKSIPREKRPFYFEFSTNEIVAAEVALGAALNGNLSAVFFKSVGLNVAADAFVQLPLLNIPGGMVVIIGDDPGAHSSQNEQDNRHYAKISYMPMLEPASPSEVYLFYKEAVKLSKKLSMPVMLRLTTHVCHAKERLSFDAVDREKMEPFKSEFDSRKNGPYIPLRFSLRELKSRALENLKKISEYAEKSDLNLVKGSGASKRGIITAGMPYLSIMETLEYAEEKPDILKLAFVNPLPVSLIKEFFSSHDDILIMEELDDIIEKEIKVIAFDNLIRTRITGKTESDDFIGEYTQEKVYKILKRHWPDLIKEEFYPLPVENPELHIGVRFPQLCPGCGHRSAFYAIKKALGKTDITVGDIGCHSLGFLPPYEMGEILLCMGASSGLAAGLSIANKDRKVLAFLGDSTFFHAGMPGITNALFNQHNFTLVLMENGTTAMTGHQNLPSTGRNFDDITEKIPVRQAIEGLGVKQIFEVDAYQQAKLTQIVKEALAMDGFKVIIAKHPCMLKFAREHRKASGEINHVEVNQQTCARVMECINEFACPSFQRGDDGKITVSRDLCIGDGSCIQTCPHKALRREK